MEKYRFEPEKNLLNALEQDYGLSSYYEIYANDKERFEEIHSAYISENFKVSKVSAPRIYKLYREVVEKIGFDNETELFIEAAPNINASSLDGFGVIPNIISLTSTLIKTLNDTEIKIVLGHEMGHLIYGHGKPWYILNCLGNMENRETMNISKITIAQLLRWARYSEISSDRVGYVVHPDHRTTGKVFIKLTSGLSDDDLDFNIDAYLAQLDELKKIKMGEYSAYLTHPNELIRLQSLILFGESKIYKENTPDKETEDKIKKLLKIMEHHPTKELEIKETEFLAAAGSYIASADLTITRDEEEYIIEILSEMTSEPEKYLNYKNREDMKKKTNELCEYFVKLNSSEKYDLFSYLVVIALADGRLDIREKKALFEIGGRLEISEREVINMIRELSEKFLVPKSRTFLAQSR